MTCPPPASVHDSDTPAGIRACAARRWPEGGPAEERIIEEAAVALSFNGISHAVMMATPTDLEDFVRGFAFTEGIIDQADELFGIDITRHPAGLVVNAELCQRQWNRLRQRTRARRGDSGCGLCGLSSLEQFTQLTNLPSHATPSPSQPHPLLTPHSLQRALTQLAQQQPLQQLTGGAHAAAWCQPDGSIETLREDVGRHNALDKLIGARLMINKVPRPNHPDTATGSAPEGFLLMTSRISFELVQKAHRWGATVLAGVSAPTSKSIEYAHQQGLCLVGFSRPGRHTSYTHDWRLNAGIPAQRETP